MLHRHEKRGERQLGKRGEVKFQAGSTGGVKDAADLPMKKVLYGGGGGNGNQNRRGRCIAEKKKKCEGVEKQGCCLCWANLLKDGRGVRERVKQQKIGEAASHASKSLQTKRVNRTFTQRNRGVTLQEGGGGNSDNFLSPLRPQETEKENGNECRCNSTQKMGTGKKGGRVPRGK